MKNSWMKVFGFTFRKTAGGKGYLATTIVVAVLLLAVIPAVMLLSDSMNVRSDNVDFAEEEFDIDISLDKASIVRAVFVGVNGITAVPGEDYKDVICEEAATLEAAAAACAGDTGAVIVTFEPNTINVLVPDDSVVAIHDAAIFADYLVQHYSAPDAGTDDDGKAEMQVLTDTLPEEEAAVEGETATEFLGFLVPYVVVMLMYFMVLIYGQSVANSAIMEKTSKLMDLFLVSVRPAHMMLGKTLATAAAGLIQVLAWIFSAIGGCALGVQLVKSVNPGTTLGIIAVFESIGGYAVMFEPAVLLTVALIIVAGFMVYCALAGVGGALASKPEDLGSVNYLFTLALVISFFACLFTGESPGMISDAVWMGYVPFTAVMVMPGRLLTGAAGVGQGLVSAGISTVAAVLICMLAGKVYAAMAFYRGKPVKPVQLIKNMLKHS